MSERYVIPPERVVLGDTDVEPAKRARARQFCASVGGSFKYLTMDMCATTRGRGPEVVVSDSRAVANFIQKYLGDAINVREYFGSLLLDAKNKIVAFAIVSQGGLAQAAVEPAMAFKPALLMPTRALIFVHNHPSGDAQPSQDDIELTKRFVQAGKLLGIPVLDHIIVAREGRYFSFLDSGLMGR